MREVDTRCKIHKVLFLVPLMLSIMLSVEQLVVSQDGLSSTELDIICVTQNSWILFDTTDRYRSRGPDSIPGTTKFLWEVVGLERGPLSYLKEKLAV
jgi:hypothetical protein